MDEKRFLFWQKFLTAANIMTVGVGLLVAFAGESIFLSWHNEYSLDLYHAGKELPEGIQQYKNLLFGIIGGTIVGFHVLAIMISENAFKKREKWAQKALWAGLLSWFVIDSSISIYYQAFQNLVGINLVALALIGLPLIMTRKAFD